MAVKRNTGVDWALLAGRIGALNGGLLAHKVWDAIDEEYVWPDGTAPDAESYTNIVFVGPEDMRTADGGRDVEGDIWMSDELADPSLTHVPCIDNIDDFNTMFGTAYTGHDYEFNAVSSSPPSGWAWVNQGSATYTERFGGGVINYPAGASINWRMLMQSVTGLPSTWTAYAKLNGMGTFSADCFFGLTLYDGTKVIDFSRYVSTPGTRYYVSQWTNVNTYSSSPLSAVQRGPMFEDNIYIRITKNSATSYDFAVSSDGVGWITLLAAYNVSAYMTPTHLGFGTSNTGSMDSVATCHWFRVR